MSLKEQTYGKIERILNAENTRRIRYAVGSLATKYHERLGSPDGQHSRKNSTEPRPDVGEVVQNAGYTTIQEVPSFPPNDRLKIDANELIERVRRPDNQPASDFPDDGPVRLYGQPVTFAPRGPQRKP